MGSAEVSRTTTHTLHFFRLCRGRVRTLDYPDTGVCLVYTSMQPEELMRGSVSFCGACRTSVVTFAKKGKGKKEPPPKTVVKHLDEVGSIIGCGGQEGRMGWVAAAWVSRACPVSDGCVYARQGIAA